MKQMLIPLILTLSTAAFAAGKNASAAAPATEAVAERAARAVEKARSDARHAASAAAQAARPVENHHGDADVKMTDAEHRTEPAASPASVTVPVSLPLPPCLPLYADTKDDIDAFIRYHLPLIQQRVRRLQQCFYHCVDSIIDDAIAVEGMRQLQISQSQNSNTFDPRVFLLLAVDKFSACFTSRKPLELFEAESKAVFARQKAVDSAIESAGAMDSFNDLVLEKSMLQSEGLAEEEIKQFEALGIKTNGVGTKQGSLAYWIECNHCKAEFKAGWNHQYYHKATCPFYRPFHFNPKIADKKRRLKHVLEAIDLAAHQARFGESEYLPCMGAWNLLHDLRNWVSWQGARWNMFLNYSAASFEEDRQETFQDMIKQHTKQHPPK